MCSHLFPIGLDIGSVIFDITEENSIFEVNRMVPDVALVNHAQYFWPDRRVITFVTFLTAGLKTNRICTVFASSSFSARSVRERVPDACQLMYLVILVRSAALRSSSYILCRNSGWFCHDYGASGQRATLPY